MGKIQRYLLFSYYKQATTFVVVKKITNCAQSADSDAVVALDSFPRVLPTVWYALFNRLNSTMIDC